MDMGEDMGVPDDFTETICHFKEKINVQPKTKLYNRMGFQFSDFQLRSFIDPKPVEL